MKKAKYQIAVIPGDGTGPELTTEGLKVLKAAQEIEGGFQLEYPPYELSARHYLRTKEIMPADEFDKYCC